MIHVTQATFLTYGGVKITKDLTSNFHEPLWKVKELLLDSVCKADDSDPIVKIINLKYREYGKD